MKDHVHFQTRMFNTTEVRAHFINPRCFGEDLALWLAERLSDQSVVCASPFQEDWGWRLPVEVGASKFFINIGLMDEPSAAPIWLAWVESRGLMSRFLNPRASDAKEALCHRLSTVLVSAPEISNVEWSAA